MVEENLIRLYKHSSPEKRVDIIIRNYTRFMGIVESYIDGLRYMMECERESTKAKVSDNLGVRVQTSGRKSDPTAKDTIRNVLTRDAIRNCDFSDGVLEGISHADVFIQNAYILRDMRNDYDLFNSQLGILGIEKEMFIKYIRKETTLSAIAEERGISYETVQQKMVKIKKQIKRQMVGFMEGKGGGL